MLRPCRRPRRRAQADGQPVDTIGLTRGVRRKASNHGNPGGKGGDAGGEGGGAIAVEYRIVMF